MEQLIYGINPVLEALKKSPDKVLRVVVVREAQKNYRIRNMINLAKKHNIRFDFIPKARVSTLTRDGNHQNIFAYLSDFEYQNLDYITKTLPKGNRKILILDSITDPHNFGSILRSCVAFEIDAVVIKDRDSCSVNETVVKTSSGTAFDAKVVMVKNLNNTVEFLKNDGFMVLGADKSEEAISYENYDFSGDLALVMGSEGKGIKRLTKSKCDQLLYIPISSKVESLNVSVAAALFIEKISKF